MQYVADKPSVPTRARTLPYYYVTRAGKIVRVSWDQMTFTERDLQRQADERAYQVVLFNLNGQEA